MTRNHAKSILDNIELVRSYAAGATLQKGDKHEWHDDQDPGFDPYHRWRVKPEPPKPREFWIARMRSEVTGLGPVDGLLLCRSKDEAFRNAKNNGEVIHVTESP